MAIPVYCTIADVEAHTGKGYKGDSHPSRTEVMRIITTVAQELNGALQAAGYTLPIPATASDALELLKGYNSLGAAYRAFYSANRGAGTFPAVESWRLDFKAALEGLRKNTIALPGIDPEDGGNTTSVAIIRSVKLTG